MQIGFFDGILNGSYNAYNDGKLSNGGITANYVLKTLKTNTHSDAFLLGFNPRVGYDEKLAKNQGASLRCVAKSFIF